MMEKAVFSIKATFEIQPSLDGLGFLDLGSEAYAAIKEFGAKMQTMGHEFELPVVCVVKPRALTPDEKLEAIEKFLAVDSYGASSQINHILEIIRGEL